MEATFKESVVTVAAVLVVLAGSAAACADRPARESGGGGSGEEWPAARLPDLPGWRWESSLGALVAVPESWGVNDYGCDMTYRPSVVRAKIWTGGCPFSERTAELVFIDLAPVATNQQPVLPTSYREPGSSTGIDLPERAVSIDGMPARRAEGRLPDGRSAGWVRVESPQVAVTVRTLDAALTARILDTVRIVEVDQVGCPARRPPKPGQPGGSPAGPLVPEHPTAIGICYYGGDRLATSARLTGDAARNVAALLNDLAGRPPHLPDACPWWSAEFALVLRVHGGGRAATVWSGGTLAHCTRCELFSGGQTVQLRTERYKELLMDPLRLYFHAPFPPR